MHIISVFLFAVSANIDNFAVGIAYGIKKIRIGPGSNLLIAAVTAAGTLAAMAAGTLLERVLPASVANIAGSAMLIAMGLWIVKDFFFQKRKTGAEKQKQPHRAKRSRLLEEPEKADRDHSGEIDRKESLVLALALAVNNMGLGIGASITGLSVFLTVPAAFFLSVLLIQLGCLVGKSCLSGFAGKFAPLASGLIIILLGIYEMLV